jgi:hypothetical protein
MPSIDELEKGFQASGTQGQPSDLEAGYRTATPQAPEAKPSFLRQLFEPEISGGPLRVIPGAVGSALGPLGASAGYGLGEYAAQKFQQATGQRPGNAKDVTDFSGWPVAIAAGLPIVPALGARIGRGAERLLTRVMPTRFVGKQQAAQAAAKELGQELAAGPQSASQLLPAARAQGGSEMIPASRLLKQLDDVVDDIGANPVSSEGKAALEYVNRARGMLTQQGTISVRELMQLRKDLGPATGIDAVSGLYKAALQDLKDASTNPGSPVAAVAQQGLEQARRERAATLWQELVQRSSKGRSAITGEQPLLSMSQLSRNVAENKDELVSLLGPQAFARIQHFITNNQSLPPQQAYTVMNSLAGMGMGAMAFLSGGGAMAVPAGILGWELLKDTAAVGRNPAAVKNVLNQITLGTEAIAPKVTDVINQQKKQSR